MLSAANWIFAAIIVWHSLTTLNAMTRASAMAPRVAFVLIAAGAFSFVLAPLYKAPEPEVGTVMFTAGVAVWCLYRTYRRKHVASPSVRAQ